MAPRLYLACDSIVTRLDAVERALRRLLEALPSAVAKTVQLGFSLSSDRAVIVFQPRRGEVADLARLAIRAADLPGLSVLPPSSSDGTDPRTRTLASCDAVVAIRDVTEAFALIRSTLGMESEKRKTARLPVPIEVRFRGPAGLCSGNTDNLTPMGTFVRTADKPPQIGETVPIAFVFDTHFVRGSATVIHLTPGPSGGFGARLMLGDQARKELVAAIRGAHPTPSAPMATVTPTPGPPTSELRLVLKTPEAVAMEYRRNISVGRLFVPTATPPPLDTRVSVLLTLPDAAEIRLPGRVMQIVTPAGARGRAGTAGCGLSIRGLDPDARALLASYRPGQAVNIEGRLCHSVGSRLQDRQPFRARTAG